MKKLKIFCAIMLAYTFSSAPLVAQNWANFNRFEKKNALVKPPLKKEHRVVFMGNSITENWVRQDPDYFSKNPYIGRGISGQVTSQMLLRFRQDVINLKPEIVVILAGTNDIAQNKGPISLDKIAGNIFSMAELAKANKIKVIICSVLPANKYSWSPKIKPADLIISLNTKLKEYCKENKVKYLNLYPLLVNDEKGLKKEYGMRNKDTVHPNLKGYRIIETAVDKAIHKLQ